MNVRTFFFTSASLFAALFFDWAVVQGEVFRLPVSLFALVSLSWLWRLPHPANLWLGFFAGFFSGLLSLQSTGASLALFLSMAFLIAGVRRVMIDSDAATPRLFACVGASYALLLFLREFRAFESLASFLF